VKWSDIGGQAEAKLRLQQCVEWPLRYPDTLKRFNLSTPSRGVLLYGPPGCSKTTLGTWNVKPRNLCSRGGFSSVASRADADTLMCCRCRTVPPQ
jgi:DNA polymerase III delta prime subunit